MARTRRSVVEIIEGEASPVMIAKAIKAYGEDFKPLWGPQFAQEVAQGKSCASSYLAIHPGASRGTAQTQGVVAAAHPTIANWIRTHVYGLPNVARALTPMALNTLRELAEQSSNLRIRLDAANSILDRGGLPKSAQLQVEGRLSIAAALDEVLADVVEGVTPSLPVLDVAIIEPTSVE